MSTNPVLIFCFENRDIKLDNRIQTLTTNICSSSYARKIEIYLEDEGLLRGLK